MLQISRFKGRYAEILSAFYFSTSFASKKSRFISRFLFQNFQGLEKKIQANLTKIVTDN
jgi:hypothetical protein